jgi:Iron-containing redox enzyme
VAAAFVVAICLPACHWLTGHYATTMEVTSSPSCRRLVEAMQQAGAGPAAVRFCTEHVEADAVSEQLVRREVIGGLLAGEPELGRRARRAHGSSQPGHDRRLLQPSGIASAGRETAGHLVSTGAELAGVPSGTWLLTWGGLLALPLDA